MQRHRDGEAPVAEVVLSVDGAADSFEEPGHGVADHGRPQVADMHLLRDVHPADVDGDPVGLGLRLDAQPIVVHAGQGFGEGGRSEPDVQEAGAGDLGDLDHVGQAVFRRHQGVGQFRGDVARRTTELLAEGHRGVQLEVPEFGLGTGLEGGVDAGGGVATDRAHGDGDGGFDSGDGILDGVHPTKDTDRWVDGTPSRESSRSGSTASSRRA